MVGGPSAPDRFHFQDDLAFLRELKGVGKQVAQNLFQPFAVRADAVQAVGVDFHGKFEALAVGHVPENALQMLDNVGEKQVFDIGNHGPRLYLGKVQDIVDQGH